MRLWPLFVIGAVAFLTIGFGVGARWQELRDREDAPDDVELLGFDLSSDELDEYMSGVVRLEPFYSGDETWREVNAALWQIRADDLVAWATSGLDDDDARQQLERMCARLPGNGSLRNDLSLVLPTPVPTDTVCDEVNVEIDRHTLSGWADEILDEIDPVDDEDRILGEALIGAHGESLRLWAVDITTGYQTTTEYAGRLCVRINTNDYYPFTSPPHTPSADVASKVNGIIDACAAVRAGEDPVAIARVITDAVE